MAEYTERKVETVGTEPLPGLDPRYALFMEEFTAVERSGVDVYQRSAAICSPFDVLAHVQSIDFGGGHIECIEPAGLAWMPLVGAPRGGFTYHRRTRADIQRGRREARRLVVRARRQWRKISPVPRIRAWRIRRARHVCGCDECW